MAMVVHARNEEEREFLKGFYRVLEGRGIGKMSYSDKEVRIYTSGICLSIMPGDLIILARNERDNAYLFSIYREVMRNPSKYNSLPKFQYIDKETIAMAKAKDKIVEQIFNILGAE